MNIFTPKKTIPELQEEGERLDAEITYEQKQAVLRQLREKSGGSLTLKDFGGRIRSVIQWLKTH